VKAVLALAWLAVLSFTVAGCGGTRKVAVKGIPMGVPPPPTVTVAGTTTIRNAVSVLHVKCQGWPGRGVRIPPPGSDGNVGGGTVTPNGTATTSHQMQLHHSENGSLTVVCMSSG